MKLVVLLVLAYFVQSRVIKRYLGGEKMKEMMGSMKEHMGKEEMKEIMDEMMSKCFADMTAEEKQRMAEEIKSGSCKEGEMRMMPQMMMKMMPHCLELMLPKLSKENKKDFVVKMASILFAKNVRDEVQA
jgi:predicted Holliday junction resolvase-like endonuclease